MPAIKPHKTEVIEAEWDANEEVARLRPGEDEAYYRRMFAWQDPDADPTTKTAYKFPHHKVSGDGEPGPAVIRGCQAGIAALNGARGGADIPDSDREGVWEHLASHLEDADVEPAPLKRGVEIPYAEWRAVRGRPELRQGGEQDSPGIIEATPGIPYDTPVSDAMGFREVIDRGAAAEAVKNEMIICTFNHNPSELLGFVGNKTLELNETDTGVNWRCVLPPTIDGRKVADLVAGGYVWGASFMFLPTKEIWEGDVRHIVDMELWEVGPVSMPAYDATRVSISRGLFSPREELALRRSMAGFATDEDMDVLYRAYRYLADLFQGEEAKREAAKSAEGRGLTRLAELLSEILRRL